MIDLRASFAGRTVFLTGHTGFKGSWLALWLSELGAKVVGFSLPPPTTPSNFVASGVADRLARNVEGDIRDLPALTRAMADAKPDVVIHMAAQPLVRDSYAIPVDTFAVNVMGTVNVLEAVRHLPHPCVSLVVTSDKCYENIEQMWGYRECDRMGGRDPYSASKGAAELVVASYRASFFHPSALGTHGKKLASVRAGNVIGGGDWAKDRLVVDLVQAFAKGEPAVVRNPRSTRPWQHVLDALNGYLTLAARLLDSDDASLCEGWNFGPDDTAAYPVDRLAACLCSAWEGGRFTVAVDPKAAHEAHFLHLDSTKARTLLGWKPRWDTSTAVRRTAAWYQRYYTRGGSMLEACLDDIRAFSAAND